jgi:hypothetical protein
VASPSNAYGTLGVACPSGKKPIAGGGWFYHQDATTGATSEVIPSGLAIVLMSAPTSDGQGWRIQFQAADSHANLVVISATCAKTS